MDIDLTAEMKPAAEFYALYRRGYQRKLWGGKGLLAHALQNNDPATRYELANYLLDRDAILDTRADGNTVLHILFGHVSHDIAQDTALARRLIERGVDINALGERHEVAFQWVLNMKYTDDDLKPIYDLWFEQPVLDFQTKNKAGFSPLELAEKVPFRATIATRMTEYIREHS